MLELYKPLQNQAYEHIVSMIESGALSYDRIYSETRLAAEIGISRTPMRDAIHRLAADGVLDIIPSKGFRLHRLTSTEILDTFQVRSAVESYCASLMAREHDMPACQKAQQLMEAEILCQEQICENGHSAEDFTHTDNRFHQLIHFYPQNNTFSQLFTRYLYRIRSITLDSLAVPRRMEDTVQEHRAILDAIRSGSEEAASSLVLNHIRMAKDLLLMEKERD